MPNHVEKAIRTVLAGDTDVAAVVSTRIYPVLIPQGAALPAITYQLLSSEPFAAHDGHTGHTKDRFQINCYSTSYATAKDLAEKVRLALSGYSGTSESVVISEIHHQGTTDTFTAPRDAGETGVHQVQLDVLVGYASTIPS